MAKARDAESNARRGTARQGRHRGREAALQMLYQWEVGRIAIDEAAESYWVLQPPGGTPPSAEVRDFATRLARGTVASLDRIDPLIVERAEHWRLSRMAALDRLILRLAVYELLEMPDTPPRVVIDEALELAKTFSGDDSVRFVNGVLDGIKRRLDREQPSAMSPQPSAPTSPPVVEDRGSARKRSDR